MNDEGVAAILGLVLVTNGGDFRIPKVVVEAGLPKDSRVAVYWEGDDVIVGIRKNEEIPVVDEEERV